MTGTIVVWKRGRGFGFVAPDDLNQPDIFIHYSFLVGDKKFLVEGQRVQFELATDQDGRLQARNVRVIADADEAVRP